MDLYARQEQAVAASHGISKATWSILENGRQDRYKDTIIPGVARALRWRNDWLDLLNRGEQPVCYDVPSEKDQAALNGLYLGDPAERILTLLNEGMARIESRLAALERQDDAREHRLTAIENRVAAPSTTSETAGTPTRQGDPRSPQS